MQVIAEMLLDVGKIGRNMPAMASGICTGLARYSITAERRIKNWMWTILLISMLLPPPQ
jgi:hypothetical protein